MDATYRDIPLREYKELLINSALGAFIMRSSACTINDIFDRELDASVGELDIRCNHAVL